MDRLNRSLKSPRVLNIEDLRQSAGRRVPRAVFDYLDGGAEEEKTLRENCRAFEDLLFRPRGGIAFRGCDLKTMVLGQEFSLPFLLAPVGYSRLLHPEGEIGAARAAGEAGTGYILSTVSGHLLEAVKSASKGPVWYQLYLMGGRAAAEGAIERAQRAGYSALAVTVDTPVAGMRERDQRNGIAKLMGDSWLAKIPYLPDILAHPSWLASFLRDGGVPLLGNVVVPGKGALSMVDVASALASSAVTWGDLAWIRKLWRGPLVVKGILTGEDAKRAVDEGAGAVVVSNHGGRQLDSVLPTLHALPEVLTAVNQQAEVLLDGGIRRGADIVKAIALGARAVLVGRAYAYGLAAGGFQGVARSIEILRDETVRTMALLGCSSLASLDRSYLELRRNQYTR